MSDKMKIKMSVRKGFFLTLLILFLLLVLRGCRGRVLPDRVIYFTGADSNKIIPSVLVITRYETSCGIRFIDGGGLGKIDILFANPFVYSSDGSPLVVKQPRSPGLFIGVFIGKVISTTGVIAIAKGYKPAFIDGDSLYSGRINSRLEALDEKEAKEQLNRISNGLRNKEFGFLLRKSLVISKDYTPKHNFSKKDLKMMESFFGIDTTTK